MKVKSIALDDEEMVQSATVEMTAAEIAFVATLIGSMNGIQQADVMRGGNAAGSAIYNALAGGIANRFYEDGVDEMVRSLTSVPA